ncbi:MAG: hypothetical protein RLZZ395_1235, partial [Pseudomonadota bacterium]
MELRGVLRVRLQRGVKRAEL